MTILPRPEALAVSEAVHGAINAGELREQGIDPRTVLDFSASVNPFGPSPLAAAAIARVAIDGYPDREATELRQTLAAKLGVSANEPIVGNGSSELLYLIALAYLRPDDPVVIVGPTYSEYARVATLMGARVIRCDAVAEDGFRIPTGQVTRELQVARPRAMFLCHPNNPTGQCLPAGALRQWIEAFPGTLFVIDEAYIDLASGCESLVGTSASNLIVLRSLTKAYALAGLRLGYAVASADVVSVLRRVRPPWSVNAVAQAAGIAAVTDDAHFQRCRRLHVEAYQQLHSGLTELGLRPLPSAAPFFLLGMPDAAKLRQELLRFRVLVRDCSSFGLPGFIRLSPRGLADNAVLLGAMQALARG